MSSRCPRPHSLTYRFGLALAAISLPQTRHAPIWRRNGILEAIWLQADLLTAADTEALAMGFLNDHQKHLLADRGDVDFAYATSFGRFRDFEGTIEAAPDSRVRMVR